MNLTEDEDEEDEEKEDSQWATSVNKCTPPVGTAFP